MQMLYNIFFNFVIANNERSSVEQFLVLKKKNLFWYLFIYVFILSFIFFLNPVSTVGSTWNLVKIGQVVSEEKLFNNITILCMYIAQAGEDNTRRIKVWL